MMDSNSFRPDGPGPARRAPDAFDDLVSHPSLGGLAGKGSRLDRLPLVTTGGAFLISLFVSLLLFGAAGGVLVVALASLPLVLTACLVRDGEVEAGRDTLRMLRGVLVGWAVLSLLLVPAPSLESPSPWGARVPAPAGGTVHARVAEGPGVPRA